MTWVWAALIGAVVGGVSGSITARIDVGRGKRPGPDEDERGNEVECNRSTTISRSSTPLAARVTAGERRGHHRKTNRSPSHCHRRRSSPSSSSRTSRNGSAADPGGIHASASTPTCWPTGNPTAAAGARRRPGCCTPTRLHPAACALVVDERIEFSSPRDLPPRVPGHDAYSQNFYHDDCTATCSPSSSVPLRRRPGRRRGMRRRRHQLPRRCG